MSVGVTVVDLVAIFVLIQIWLLAMDLRRHLALRRQCSRFLWQGQDCFGLGGQEITFSAQLDSPWSLV